MALAASLDRTPPNYTHGDTLTLTVTTAPGERGGSTTTPGTVSIDIPGVGSADVAYVLTGEGEPEEVIVTDPDLVWVLESDDGTVAAFTATA